MLAHECGHGGFTDSRLVNDAVGFVLHSSLLSPYFSWAITHAKHHHYTNHMTMGETWVPSTAHPSKAKVREAKTVAGTIKRIVIVALAGWYAYLFLNATGAKQNVGQSHFNPKSRALFKPKDAAYVRASNVGMLALWDSFEETKSLPAAVKTVAASASAAVFRVFLMPIDAMKTTLQVHGADGLTLLGAKMKTSGPFVLWHGATGAMVATFVGHCACEHGRG